MRGLSIKSGLTIILFLIAFGIIIGECGCYEDPAPVYGYYLIQSDQPVDIVYTNQVGVSEVITSKDFEYPMEFGEDVDLFWYEVRIHSETPQDVYVKIFFNDGESQMDYEKTVYVSDDWSYKGFYCTPWSKSCSRVTVNF